MQVAEANRHPAPLLTGSPVIRVVPENVVVLQEPSRSLSGLDRVIKTSAPLARDLRSGEHAIAFRSVGVPLVGHDGEISGVMFRSIPIRACVGVASRTQAQRISAVNELTSIVAHDINNLLAVIDGGLRLLDRQDNVEAREKILSRLHRAIERGAVLSRRLSDACVPRSASGDVSTRGHLIAAADTLPHALSENMVMEIEVDPDLWDFSADPEELYFSLLNLCRNSDAAAPSGGLIAVSAQNVGPFAEALGGAVAVTVADNGAGMPEEVLARAFEPYFTTKAAGKGTGIGLAQVREFVERSGGVVQVESKEGLGTAVRMIFPRLSPVAGLLNAPARH